MEVVSVIARVVLALVFAVAAAAKLRDREGTRSALVAFRVPARLAAPGAAALPVVEILVAVTVLVAPTARVGACVAVTLLASFTLAVGAALRRGEHPDCHCFGQAVAAPASGVTVGRNLVLIGFGLAAASRSAPSLSAWASDAGAGGTAAAAAATLLLAAVLMRAGAASGLSDGPSALQVGSAVPSFRLTDYSNRVVTERDLGRGRPGLITFISPGCGPCQTLVPELAEWQESMAERLRLHVLASGDDAAFRHLAESYGLTDLIADPSGDLARRMGSPATPSAILIDADGRIASAPAAGPVAIEALMRAATGLSASVPAAPR